MSAFAVFLDTCVLVPPTLCDLILRLAEQRAFEVRWSPDVVAELRAVLNRHGVRQDLADKKVDAMLGAFPMAMVSDYEAVIGAMTNDVGDRHVLAATFRSDAQAIVTFNLRDFPTDSASPYDVEVIHPDDFLLHQLDMHPGAVMTALRAKAAESRRPAMSEGDILARLRRTGLPGFADEAIRHL